MLRLWKLVTPDLPTDADEENAAKVSWILKGVGHYISTPRDIARQQKKTRWRETLQKRQEAEYDQRGWWGFSGVAFPVCASFAFRPFVSRFIHFLFTTLGK